MRSLVLTRLTDNKKLKNPKKFVKIKNIQKNLKMLVVG